LLSVKAEEQLVQVLLQKLLNNFFESIKGVEINSLFVSEKSKEFISAWSED
jgi:hypothetical protein